MPNVTTLSLVDRAATPVTHTFEPYNQIGDVTSFVDRANVPIDDKTLTIRSISSATKEKVSLRLVLPVSVTETLNGVDHAKNARVAIAQVDFSFDRNSTLAERKDLVGMVASALAADQSAINPVLTNLERFY